MPQTDRQQGTSSRRWSSRPSHGSALIGLLLALALIGILFATMHRNSAKKEEVEEIMNENTYSGVPSGTATDPYINAIQRAQGIRTNINAHNSAINEEAY